MMQMGLQMPRMDTRVAGVRKVPIDLSNHTSSSHILSPPPEDVNAPPVLILVPSKDLPDDKA